MLKERSDKQSAVSYICKKLWNAVNRQSYRRLYWVFDPFEIAAGRFYTDSNHFSTESLSLTSKTAL